MLVDLLTEKPLPKNIEEAFKSFLNHTPPERLSRTIRTLLMEYLVHQHEFLPTNFHCYLDDLSSLFTLLDNLNAETKGWYTDEEELEQEDTRKKVI